MLKHSSAYQSHLVACQFLYRYFCIQIRLSFYAPFTGLVTERFDQGIAMYEWRRKPPHTVEYNPPTTAKLNPQVRLSAYFIFVTDHAYFRPDAGLSQSLVRGRVTLHVF